MLTFWALPEAKLEKKVLANEILEILVEEGQITYCSTMDKKKFEGATPSCGNFT